MLWILLKKQSNESGGVAKRLPPETVRVACPDHLVLADIPIAKSLGSVNPASLVKAVGRRSLHPPDVMNAFRRFRQLKWWKRSTSAQLRIAEKDDYISESASSRKPAASESTLQVPPRPIFSPRSGSQVHDREDKAYNSQTRDQQPPWPFMQQKPPFTGSIQNHPLEQQSDSNCPPGFERPGMQNWLPQ